MERFMHSHQYDLVVIGSGPAGQKGAIAATKLGKSVAVIDRKDMLGGVSLHSGTIPSKTLREAILYLSGLEQRAFYGKDYSLKEKINQNDLRLRIRKVLDLEIQIIKDQFKRNGIKMINGTAQFIDTHTLEITSDLGKTRVTGEKILIACGTRPAHNPNVPVDGKKIFDVDQLELLEEIPKEIIIVGAGVIGLEFAAMFAALNIEVTVIEQRDEILDFVDKEIVERLSYHLRNLGVVFRLGEMVISVELDLNGQVVASLESRKKIRGSTLLYAVGRQTNADTLNLEAVGIETDHRGKINVDELYKTTAPEIFAVGDVIGFPALAATSMEQGRIASYHMFGYPVKHSPEILPYGIYTIPEISMIGKTEQQLTEEKIPYEFGIAKYDELARGQIHGDRIGLLKILFDPDDLRVLGVHAIGESATELIHIGQSVMYLEGTMEYFRDAVFNYPTLAEAYKVAALDGLNKL
jgi:NAD(P) transhydrogenase